MDALYGHGDVQENKGRNILDERSDHKSRIMSIAMVAAFTAGAENDAPVRRLSDMVVRIDMRNLLKIPVGDTLLGAERWYAPCDGGLSSVKVPREWSDGAKCDALRVSDVIVDGKSNSIRGGLGSNVYPTVAEGAFAMTNQILSAVSEVSSGKALVVPLRFEEKNRYCEMVFTWKPSPDCAEDRELVVRGYVNGKRQMAVCCCLHTKGDGIKAGFALLPDRMMPAQRTRRSASLPNRGRAGARPSRVAESPINLNLLNPLNP